MFVLHAWSVPAERFLTKDSNAAMQTQLVAAGQVTLTDLEAWCRGA